MNLQQLRALSVLADENFNISKAAQLLCLTQSATSKQLSQLEEALGVPLLQRTSNRTLGLTPIGEDVLNLPGDQRLRPTWPACITAGTCSSCTFRSGNLPQRILSSHQGR